MIEADDLVNHAWLLALRRRAADKLRGCAGIVSRLMYNHAAYVRTGQSAFKRKQITPKVSSLEFMRADTTCGAWNEPMTDERYDPVWQAMLHEVSGQL